MIIGQNDFEGPFTRAAELKDLPGVYVILCDLEDDKYDVLAVDYCTKSVRRKLMDNADHDIWIYSCKGRLLVAAFYSDEDVTNLAEIKTAIQLEMCT